jgi:hypothetical protein
MEKQKCPNHIGTGVTPKDIECHSHVSNLQQFFHNLHCRISKCFNVLYGEKRHDNLPIIGPRNLLEKFLHLIDKKKKEFFN